MFKTKSLAAILLVVAVLFAQVGIAFAAPAQTSTPITGTVTGLSQETDSNGVTTVLVTVKDDTGAEQTYRVSVDTAVTLGLATLDTTTNTVTLLDLTQSPQPMTVTIDPTAVIPDQQTTEFINPISSILATFFGLDSTTVQDLHNDGFGFGVIVQALWISRDTDGNANADVAGDILTAKQSKDYATFFENHPEYADQFGDNLPTNWGQFKKVLAEHKNNLGSIVSGHADNGTDETTTTTTSQKQHGNGKNDSKGNDNGKNNGKGNGNGNKP